MNCNLCNKLITADTIKYKCGHVIMEKLTVIRQKEGLKGGIKREPWFPLFYGLQKWIFGRSCNP